MRAACPHVRTSPCRKVNTQYVDGIPGWRVKSVARTTVASRPEDRTFYIFPGLEMDHTGETMQEEEMEMRIPSISELRFGFLGAASDLSWITGLRSGEDEESFCFREHDHLLPIIVLGISQHGCHEEFPTIPSTL